jgi:hypothetical protein
MFNFISPCLTAFFVIFVHSFVYVMQRFSLPVFRHRHYIFGRLSTTPLLALILLIRVRSGRVQRAYRRGPTESGLPFTGGTGIMGFEAMEYADALLGKSEMGII